MLFVIKRGNLTLANHDWSVGVAVGDFPVAVRREIDSAAGVGAAGPTNFDRTTRVVEMEFKVTRQHANTIASIAFAATHDATATGVADLVIEATDDDGVGVRLKMKGGKWASLTSDPVGMSTDTTYRVSGGPFAATQIGTPEEPGEFPVEVPCVRDVLLTGPYGPLPGILWLPAPWNGGLPPSALVTSPTLEAMA